MTNIGLVNHPAKIDTNIVCTLEADLGKLFESNKVVFAIVNPDANITWHDSLFIQYEQIRLNDNFRKYLETRLIVIIIFIIGIHKTLLQKSYKFSVAAQSYNVERQ